MRALGLCFGAIATVSALACSVTTTDKGGGSSGQPAPSSSGTSASPPSSSSSGSGSPPASSTSSAPPASTVAANVTIASAACPVFQACGGSPQGTYDYTGGCLGDVFADARSQCPGLETSNVNATVQGSITFDGNALVRDATAHVTGSIFFPSSCSYGQCSSLETAIKGGFDSVSCSPKDGGCDCQIARTDHGTDATTFTIAGSTLTTADGDQYAICEQGSSLGYRGKSASAEDGTWTMKKR